MLDVKFIEKLPQRIESQDYAFLRTEGLAHIEKLAHRLWTDYNVHDPGITILEHLCYAITDLGHRTGYDIKDLLTETIKGLPKNTSNFHQAREILTSSPISFDDLRKILIDIHGVRNAWIEKHTSVAYWLNTKEEKLVNDPGPPKFVAKNPSLNGLYDVFIEYEEFVKELRVGLPDQTEGKGEFIQPGGRGIRFHVAHEMTLQAVHVYADRSGTVTFQLKNKKNQELCSFSMPVPGGRKKFRVPLEVRITPGEDYQFIVSATDNSGIKLYRRSDPSFPYAIEDLVYLVSGIKDQNIQAPYFFFYDWEVSCSVPPSSQHHPGTVIESVGLPNHDGEGGLIDALGKGINFEVYRDVLLKGVEVYPEKQGSVTVRLLDMGKGHVLEAYTQQIDVEGGPITIALSFKLRPGTLYRLDAQGTNMKLFRNTGVSFPIGKETVLRLLTGFPSEGMYYFFYNWTLSYPAYPEPFDVTPGQVRWAAKKVLHEHRNLCEDFVNVCDVETEEIAVCADLEVAPAVDVEAVLAEMFFRLGQDISPRVRFYTIDELLAKGKTTDQIFEGPKLEHGFIDDEEFQAINRKCEIRVSDVIQTILNVSGVLAVKNISLLSFVEGDLGIQEEWILRLTTKPFRAPEFSSERSKVIFYKNNLPYYPNRHRVEQLLKERKAAEIQTKLKGHQNNLPIPFGEDKQLDTYYPIQNELPANYRVGRLRVAESESSLRKAQSRQLKAYLLFFEQILANYLSQLAHVRKLFSWESGKAETYFTQAVIDVSDIGEMYDSTAVVSAIQQCDPPLSDPPDLNLSSIKEEDRQAYFLTTVLPVGLKCIIENAETAHARKGRFLDHLLARFGESFTDYSLLMVSILKDQAPARVIEDKRMFLQEYPSVSSRRGMAYDYRYPAEKTNLSGYQYRLYRLLGFPLVERRNLAGDRFSIEQGIFVDPCWDPEKDPEEERDREGWRFILTQADGAILFTSCVCESQSAIELLLDFALSIGGNEDNYHQEGEGETYRLMRRCRDESKDEPIGATTVVGKAVMEQVRDYFELYGESEGCHVVEHILLRKRTTKDPFLDVQLSKTPPPDPQDCGCVEVKDPYSFRMTVVLPSWPRRFRDLKFRKFVEETFRRETPAHIFPKICWISHEQMKAFEQCYNEWAGHLASLDPRLGGCRTSTTQEKAFPLSGQLPLPETGADEESQVYSRSLDRVIGKLQSFVTVYPLARLHDCKDVSGDTPQVTLDNTNLGTL